ncbi:DUF4229 domain-containing protein [Tsukamurella soli]|uniref:DUF4229 domain-containing protein n=1 Tax=Tsukamurella soli TaxID=644556 RepID=A0ABP8JR93_9ACTN
MSTDEQRPGGGLQPRRPIDGAPASGEGNERGADPTAHDGLGKDAPVSPGEAREARRSLTRDLLLYTGYRVVLVAVIAAILDVVGRLVAHGMPLIIALLFALIIALPVSMVTTRSLRRRINASVAVLDAQRRGRRDAFRKRLQGRVE